MPRNAPILLFLTVALNLAVIVLASSSAKAETPLSITVIPAAGPTQTWTVDRLKQNLAAEVKSVDYESRGTKHRCRAVSLLALLNASGVSTEFKMHPAADPTTKNPLLRMAVLVEGRDGYAIVVSVGDLLPQIGQRAAWISFEEDEKALPEREQPMKFIVPGDAAPGRWVRGIARISVINITPPSTTQPTP